MGSGKNTKQKKDKGSRKILGVIEGVYNGKQYIEEGGRFEKCKGLGE